jgi:uncharacterized protein
MNKLDKFCSSEPRRHLLAWLATGAAALWLAAAAGAAPVDLYQAAVPQTDRSDAGLSTAFQNAMRIVVVRVTGHRAAATDPAFAPLVQNARRYMQQYRAIGGNQIAVSFDSDAIDRWLSESGAPLWGRERPITAVWLALPNPKGGGSIVTREDSVDLKHSLDTVALARGIELRWPSAAEVQASGVSYQSVAGETGNLVEAAQRLGAEGVLSGKANGPGIDQSIRWNFTFQGHSADFSGGSEAANRLADTYASIFAASGGTAPVEFDISGLADLRAYANVESYLESLTSISHLNVISFEGDTARFRALARGGADSLRHAVTLDGRLESAVGEAATDLRFRLTR